jgi:hypothetical protein
VLSLVSVRLLLPTRLSPCAEQLPYLLYCNIMQLPQHGALFCVVELDYNS